MKTLPHDYPAIGGVRVCSMALERFQLHNRRAVALNALRVQTIEDIARMTGDMAIELSAYVWSQNLQDEKVTLAVRYPATLWQGFKQRWFPRWALNRWPVRETEISQSHRFRTIALFPGYRYEAPDDLGREHIISYLESTCP